MRDQDEMLLWTGCIFVIAAIALILLWRAFI
jgi:hypothetical protein